MSPRPLKLIQAIRSVPKPPTWSIAAVLGILLVGSGFAFRYRQDDLTAQSGAAEASSVPPEFSPGLSQASASMARTQRVLRSLKSQSKESPATAKAPASDQPASSQTAASESAQPQAQASSSANTTPADAQPTATTMAAAPAPLTAHLSIDAVLEMRVAVARNVGSVSIGTSTPGLVVDVNGQIISELSAQVAYEAQADGGGIALGPQQMPAVFWVEPTEGGYVLAGDRWYRGRLLVMSRENGLLAVNYVPLRDYLYSVVGGEVSPSWPMEALKAQAVAARSYALTHNIRPASDHYDLDNTERFQFYGGVAKEANTTYAAVDGTSGEFISYEGGIVESLYAASDHIVETVHGGRGMSQLGALDLAEQGYSYEQILGNYYPGTALARLEMDPF